MLTESVISNINLGSKIHKNYKNAILNEFLEKNKDLAPQGSVEWLADRRFNIGGSEMSTITGDNCYCKLDQLVAQKTGFFSFSGNIATRWGKLFEFVTQILTSKILDIDEIKETGSINGSVPNQKYSPDGLAVIKLICNDNLISDVETTEYCIVLFEFKSPLYSIPSGFIPKHYLPQVKTGLCSIPITDFAIFINNMFRKCAFEDLDSSGKYDTEFHNRDEKHNLDNLESLAFGMILFYQTQTQKKLFYEKYKDSIYICESNTNSNSKYKTEEKTKDVEDSETDDSSDDSLDIFNNIMNENTTQKPYVDSNSFYNHIYNNTNPIDFGKSNYRTFNDILQLFDDKLVSVKYCEPHILKEYNNNEFLKAQLKNKGNNDYTNTIEKYKEIITTENDEKIIGYLPWKLIRSDIIYEPRDAQYIKKYENDIQNTISIIKKINGCNSESDKINMFKDFFPKSKIIKDDEDLSIYLPKNI